MLVYLLALVAAVFIGAGWVAQQHAAESSKAGPGFSVELIVSLLRRREWLLGIGLMIAGQLSSAGALGSGSLPVAEPLMSANLLVALLVAARWRRRRPANIELGGAVLVTVGIAMFVLEARPQSGSALDVGAWTWAASLGLVAAVASLLIMAGRGTRRPPAQVALLWGASAGAWYGLQDALTQRMLDRAEQVGLGVLTSWSPYLLVLIAVIGLVVAQNAFAAAPLRESLPAITIVEPLTGIAFGAGVYGSSLTTTAGAVVVEIVGLVVMVLGLYFVASSHTVTGG